MRYMFTVEHGETSWGAYVPDLPGCIAAGGSREEVLELIRGASISVLEGSWRMARVRLSPRPRRNSWRYVPRSWHRQYDAGKARARQDRAASPKCALLVDASHREGGWSIRARDALGSCTRRVHERDNYGTP